MRKCPVPICKPRVLPSVNKVGAQTIYAELDNWLILLETKKWYLKESSSALLQFLAIVKGSVFKTGCHQQTDNY